MSLYTSSKSFRDLSSPKYDDIYTNIGYSCTMLDDL